MKKILLLLALPVIFVASLAFAADSPNYFDFVEGNEDVVRLDLEGIENCGGNNLSVVDGKNEEIYNNDNVYNTITEINLQTDVISGTLPYIVYACGSSLHLIYSGPSAPAASGDAGRLASGTFDLKGYAWSSNFGWVSFNSANAGIGGGGAYKVTLNTETGAFNGYAWSPNLGWLSFNSNDTDDCPPDTSCSPKISNLTTGKVTGWIRALSASTSAANSHGWYELSGTNHDSPGTGITYDDGELKGYAWGGNLGWLQFYNVTCPDCEEQELEVPSLGASTGTCGGNVDLSWSESAGATGYKIYRDGNTTTPIRTITSGTVTTYTDTVALGSTHTYQIRAVKDDEETALSTPADEATASGACTSTGLDLRIGVSATNARSRLGQTDPSTGLPTGKGLSITAGEPFGLAWTNTLSADAKTTCQVTIASPLVIPGFTNITVQTGTTASPGSTSVAGTGTSGLAIASYPITISCPGGPATQTVILKVTSSDESPT